MTKYLVIQKIHDSAEFEGTKEEFVAWAQARGMELDEPPFEDRPHLLAALQGQPKFKGFWGPGSNGDPVRYEDWATFNLMSS